MATIASVQQTLLDNADYEATQNVTKAKAFVTACTQYLILFPTSSSNDGTTVAYDPNQVKAMMAHARAFIRANSSPSRSVRFLSVESDYR